MRRTLAAVAFLLTIVPGYYSLMDSGPGRIWLRVIAAIAALVLTGSLLEATAVDRVRKLRRDLATAQGLLADERAAAAQQISTYQRAVARITDREKFLYTDEVNLTVQIGEDDDGDHIIERHVTTPKPFLSHRTLRLTVPTGQNTVSRMEDLRVRWSTHDAPVNIDVLPLVEVVDQTRVWLIFYPGIRDTVEWEISYAPRRLWAPLRSTGSDYFAWDSTAPAQVDARFLSKFTVSFIFPAGNPRVGVRGNHGSSSAPRQLATGQWQVDWRDPAPKATRYTWELVVTRPESAA